MRRWVSSPDIAIDLGTANTRLYALGKGVIADEPSLVSVKADTGRIEAVGARAARMAGRSPDTISVAPLHSGVVADVDAAVGLLKNLIGRARRAGLLKPRALACTPTDACEEEKAAVVEATRRAGASAVALVPEPLAAAIGAGLDITLPYAQMLVDIGDGVTDIAVIRSSTLIRTSAVRTACSDLHQSISHTVAFRYGVLLYPRESERLTHVIGASSPDSPATEEKLYQAYGIDLLSGDRVSVCVSSSDLIEAIEPSLQTIVDAIHDTVRGLEPRTSCEVIENGICLTGGGAQMRGITTRISRATSLEVHPAPDPMRAVINGAQQMLKVGVRTDLWRN